MIGEARVTPAGWSALLAAMIGGLIAGAIFVANGGLGGPIINLLWHWAAGAAAFAFAAFVRNRFRVRT